MENYRLVLPEHLNHYGFLFGGHLLKWVDEHAWIAASLDYPQCHFVTIAMDRVEFRKSIQTGTILRLVAEKVSKGTTSVQYRVTVFRGAAEANDEALVFSTCVTLVRVDEQGTKTPLPAE